MVGVLVVRHNPWCIVLLVPTNCVTYNVYSQATAFLKGLT